MNTVNKLEDLNTYLNILKDKSFISDKISGEYFDNPFPYILLKNIFNDEVYANMCRIAVDTIDKINDIYVASGGQQYGKIASLNVEDLHETGYGFFASKDFRDFIAKIFYLKLEKFIATSIHCHDGTESKPSIKGWVHTDMNVCTFDKNPQNNRIYNDLQLADANYASQPTFIEENKYVQTVRSVAYLYYLNNKKDLTDDDGGGTGIYNSSQENNPIKVIPPVNNSLFIFKVHPNSFHGVLPAKFKRYAHVGWMHSSPCFIARHYFNYLVKSINNSSESIRAPMFENWHGSSSWALERCPDYDSYFPKPLKFLKYV
jgi:hypothetical protein